MLIIAGQEIFPGSYQKILLPMPELYDGSPLSLAAHVYYGEEPGPILTVLGAVHGDELNGIEIIRRLLKNKKLKKIRGTLIAVPVVNVYGMLYQQRYLMDRRDLNRSFPGTEKGSLASRVAYLIYSNFILPATHVIDLHTGSLHRTNLPQIRIDLDDGKQKELALAFNAPVILNSKEREGSLRKVCGIQNKTYLLYESGEALRLEEKAIRFGVNGILRVMTQLKMMDFEIEKRKVKSAISLESVWIRARRNGFFQNKMNLGKQVKKGDTIGLISDPMDTKDFKVKSPVSGIIIGLNNIPLVHEGAAVFHIAIFEKLSKAQIELLDLIDDQEAQDMIFQDE